MIDKLKTGFVYEVEHVRNGVVLSTECVHNLTPQEMLDDIQAVVFKNGVQKAAWYLGLYEGDYAPTLAAKAATIVATATECTAYNEANRVQWVGGDVSGGAVSNADTKAEFTFNAEKNVYGGFLISSSGKGSGLGVLASVVRFAAPKNMGVGDILRIKAGTTLVPM